MILDNNIILLIFSNLKKKKKKKKKLSIIINFVILTITSTVSVQNNCSSKIKNKGYDCCSPECKATYTDEDGNWTIENGQWCGCENIKSDIANTECATGIIEKRLFMLS